MNGAGLRYQEGQETFSLPQNLKTLAGAHPASYSILLRFFLWSKSAGA